MEPKKGWRSTFFPYQLTPRGKFLLVITLALLLAAVNTGNNLLYLLVSLFISSYLLSFPLSRAVSRGVRVKVKIPPDLWAGERFFITLKMINDKRHLSTPPLFLHWGGDFQPTTTPFIPDIPPGESISLKVEHCFDQRGSYQLSYIEMRAFYPFGLMARMERLDAALEMLVYPAIEQKGGVAPGKSRGEGILESRMKGWGHSLHSLREYVPGDDVRFLHWKASAKLSRLMVKEFAREDERRVSLILDTSPGKRKEKGVDIEFEKCVKLAASLAWHFIAEDYSVQLLTPQRDISAGFGIPHLFRILRFLAVVQPSADAKEGWQRQLLSCGELSGGLCFWILTKGMAGSPFLRGKVMVLSPE